MDYSVEPVAIGVETDAGELFIGGVTVGRQQSVDDTRPVGIEKTRREGELRLGSVFHHLGGEETMRRNLFALVFGIKSDAVSVSP